MNLLAPILYKSHIHRVKFNIYHTSCFCSNGKFNVLQNLFNKVWKLTVSMYAFQALLRTRDISAFPLILSTAKQNSPFQSFTSLDPISSQK